ncbi:tetratricopeptide repeat protein [Caballeronia sp. LjRoot31]|uniref:tetratricopeptide repeat protein n=1 Tax=Caballeronia sp. LjRoot31 TaxID=3342324 RepID=UPI003ECCCFB9
MEFVGREKELAVLRKAWRAALYGKPQVVVLVAEARLGKTRIVQEFYRWLNQFEDPGNYWPDTLPGDDDSLHVNPVFEGHLPHNLLPPWLWWGLRWVKPALRNPGEVAPCAAISAADHLRPHVEAARRHLEKRETERRALVGVGKTVANLATFGLAGTAIEIFERGADLYELRKYDAGDQRSILARRAAQSETELGHLSEHLLALTSTDKIVPGGMPLILVLDDVHWADPESLQFVQRLMRELASRGRDRPEAPTRLLIIATSWEREWNEATAQPISTLADSRPVSFSDAIRALQHQAHDSGVVGPQLTECRLGRLKTSLEHAVAQELPGLTATQCALVAQLAGGSPGLLVELLAKLKNRSKHLFEQSDVSRELTPRGEAKVRGMSVSYHELVEERLQDLDAVEASVLRLASYVGLSFSRPIVQDLAGHVEAPPCSNLGAEDVESALLQADNPLAIIQAVADRLDEFRLLVYRDVLRRQLEESDDLWRCVEEHVPALIRRWLDETMLGGLPAEAKKIFLVFASGEMYSRLSERSDEDARMPLLQAWAEQICDLEVEGRTEPMAALLDMWLRVWREGDEANTLRIGRRRLEGVLQCAFAVDRVNSVAEIAGGCLGFMPAVPATEEQSALLSMLLRYAGDAALAIDDLAGSSSQFDRFRTEALRALDAFGPSAERLRDVSVSMDRVGDVLLGQDQVGPALALYRESLEICERILREFGPNATRLRDVSVSMETVGTVLSGQDRVEPALALFGESLDIRERILRKFGPNAERLRDISVSKDRVGDVLLGQDRVEPALALFGESLDIREGILREFGPNAERLRDVSVSKDRVGGVRLAQDQAEPALALFRESLGIRERILREFGPNAERLRDVSASKNRVGDVLLGQDQAEPALALFRESLEIREGILRELGPNAERLRDICVSLQKMVNGLEASSMPKEASGIAHRGLGAATQLVAVYPSSDGTSIAAWFESAIRRLGGK